MKPITINYLFASDFGESIFGVRGKIDGLDEVNVRLLFVVSRMIC